MHLLTPIFTRLPLTLLLFGLISTTQAATYYFSTSQGDDNRTAAQAQSPSTPWKTIAKLNAIFSTLAPGDVIMFNRGEVFEGSIVATKSGVAGNPIVFSAYGTGAWPVISSFATLSGWVSLGNGIWEAPLTTDGATLNLVTINDVPRAMGRYPNADAPNRGYLTIDGYVSNTQITDNQLPASPNWNGAEVVIRKNRWIIDRNKITGHSGTVINYTSASFYNAGTGYGYFIQNHAATLDSFGEWYYNKGTGKLQVHFGAAGPAGYAVKASRYETGVALRNYQHLSFSNLAFQGANLKTFDVNNTNGISVVGCDILFSGGDAISGTNAQNTKLENSTITHTYSTAFGLIWQCPGATVKNNVIKNTGFLAGMGQSGDFTYQAVLAIGDNALIEGNRVEATGGAPLSFRGNNAVCKNNVVDGFAFVKDDAGAIHIWNNMADFVPFTGEKILDNLILNGTGAPEGTPNPDLYLSEGIYLDDNSANVEVARNTVSRCGKGLFVHNAHELDIHDNSFFDNRDWQVFMEHDNVAADKPIRNVLFNNNVLASKDPRQGMMSLRTKDNDIAQFGTFNYNYYTRTIGGNAVAVQTITGKGTSSEVTNTYSLDRWKTVYGFEANSTENTPLRHYQVNSLVGANKFSNQTFSNNSFYPLWRYAPANNLELAVDNTNKLDGNSVRAYFTSATTTTGRCLVYASVGAVDASKKYILKFSVLGANANRVMQAVIESDNGQAVARKSFKTTTTRKDYEFLLEPSAGLASSRLVFEFAEPDGNFWLDNIELYEADVTVDPGHVRFEYNETAAAKTVALGGFTYLNAKGATRSGSLNLAPFASEVLMKLGVPPPPPCTASGTILREYWANVAGSYVGAIPVTTAPTSTSQLTSFEAPSNAGESYGQRVRGYLCAPATGSYTFYVASDDDSELWLSTDANPANKVKIASVTGWAIPREWTKYPSQQSAVITLQANQKYYIEALHKEGAGGDNLAVGWKIPGSATTDVIPGSVLSPFVTQTCTATGTIYREYWADVAGEHISLLPLNTAPTSTSYLTSLETAVNAADNYGQRIRGYICAPASGNYTFYVASDNTSALYLSTDENPANKVKIAFIDGWTNAREWNKYPSQMSGVVALQANQKYYVEVLHKEGAGGDNLAVGWMIPGTATIDVIPGSVLSPFVPSARVAAAETGATTESLAVYPNPFDDKLTLRLGPAHRGPVMVTVTDVLGKVYHRGSIGAGDTPEATIDLAGKGMRPGLY
ncbi:MAG: right-handed parallel beta-helix repeat-containing protein, partial [Cytophagales bacterium]|nr:right-handed parallel beta-helix repeat-containing protein [Cytophagales bacterium]